MPSAYGLVLSDVRHYNVPALIQQELRLFHLDLAKIWSQVVNSHTTEIGQIRWAAASARAALQNVPVLRLPRVPHHLPVELREHHHGHVELARQALHAPRDFGHLLVAAPLFPAAGLGEPAAPNCPKAFPSGSRSEGVL